MDLWPVDIRRFARFNGNDTWLHDRVKETLGLHYAMPWPNRELDSPRGRFAARRFTTAARRGRRVRQQDGLGARQLFRANAGSTREIDYAFGQQNWLPQ